MTTERTTRTLPGWLTAIAAILLTIALAIVAGFLSRPYGVD